MIKIFEPILHFALVCIDDILLFFAKHENHMTLVKQLYSLNQQYSIMLSQKRKKKMKIAQPSINFPRLIIQNGKIQF